MGSWRFVPKEEKLEFVVLKSADQSEPGVDGIHPKKPGSSIRITCGSFSIEIDDEFDARLLDQVLPVVEGCQC